MEHRKSAIAWNCTTIKWGQRSWMTLDTPPARQLSKTKKKRKKNRDKKSPVRSREEKCDSSPLTIVITGLGVKCILFFLFTTSIVPLRSFGMKKRHFLGWRNSFSYWIRFISCDQRCLDAETRHIILLWKGHSKVF